MGPIEDELTTNLRGSCFYSSIIREAQTQRGGCLALAWALSVV